MLWWILDVQQDAMHVLNTMTSLDAYAGAKSDGFQGMPVKTPASAAVNACSSFKIAST